MCSKPWEAIALIMVMLKKKLYEEKVEQLDRRRRKEEVEEREIRKGETEMKKVNQSSLFKRNLPKHRTNIDERTSEARTKRFEKFGTPQLLFAQSLTQQQVFYAGRSRLENDTRHCQTCVLLQPFAVCNFATAREYLLDFRMIYVCRIWDSFISFGNVDPRVGLLWRSLY